MVCAIGIEWSHLLQRSPSISALDPVNPDLDTDGKFAKTPRNAGQHVQCVHCSITEGTPEHDRCDEDWVMGNCGITQAAASVFPYGSHGLCPYFYVYGMSHAFLSRPMPSQCTAENATSANVGSFGKQRMGYKGSSLAG